MLEEGHTDISAEKDVMKKYTPVLSARSALCRSAIVLKPLKPSTCFESKKVLPGFGSLIPWCALVVW